MVRDIIKQVRQRSAKLFGIGGRFFLSLVSEAKWEQLGLLLQELFAPKAHWAEEGCDFEIAAQ